MDDFEIVLPDPVFADPELDVNRRLTKAFIDRLPLEVVLVPRTRTRTASGGFALVEGPARDPQIMTLIESGTVDGTPRPVAAQDGVDRVIDFTLLGEWDAQLARYDTFTHQGKDWEIIDLFHDNGYERRALVSRRG